MARSSVESRANTKYVGFWEGHCFIGSRELGIRVDYGVCEQCSILRVGSDPQMKWDVVDVYKILEELVEIGVR